MWQANPLALVDPIDPRLLLPPREGSLILVLGGTAVLVLSLAIALVNARSPLRRASPTPHVGPRPKRAGAPTPSTTTSVDRSPRSRLELHTVLLKATARAGLGIPQIVTCNPGSSALVLVDRLRGRSRGSRSGCGWKQETLEKALCSFVPQSQVVQVSCRSEEHRVCIFEIQTGEVGT